MASKEVYNSIKSFKNIATDIFESADKNDDEVIKLTSDFIKSDHMKAKFENLEPSQYSDFDNDLLVFIGNIIDVYNSSTIRDSHNKLLDSYELVLKQLSKD